MSTTGRRFHLSDLPNLAGPDWEQIDGDFGSPLDYGGAYLNHATGELVSLYGMDWDHPKQDGAALMLWCYWPSLPDADDYDDETLADAHRAADETPDPTTPEGRARIALAVQRYAGANAAHGREQWSTEGDARCATGDAD